MIFTRLIAIVAAAMLVGATLPTEVSALEKQELKCAKKLPGTALKLASTILKETTKCLDADISGKAIGACPSAANLTKIQSAQDRLLADIEKNCASTCSVSGLTCIATSSCPAFGATRETCNAGAKLNPFEISNLGFPGGLCPPLIVGKLFDAGDVSDCVSSNSSVVTDAYLAGVYGSITNGSGLTAEAGKCLSSISKAALKLGETALKTSNKCRDGINKGKIVDVSPVNCLTADAKSADKVAKAEAKLAKAIDTKCTDGDIGLLDLCGNGVGGTADKAAATTCLTAQSRQLFVAASIPYEQRSTGVPSLEEVVYPVVGHCGDGLVNVLQGPFNQYAEECDGASDAACPGECLPPGDLFECSCGDVLRSVYQSDAALSELDSGWTGNSHDALVGEKGGFVTEVTNCDCTLFDGPTCIGTSVDEICDTTGIQMPRCSWDPVGSTGCDGHGDGDGVATDADCFVCDAESSNAGTSCTTDGDCNSQCIDAGGSPTGPCNNQTDCGAGEICLGKCDFEATCLIVLLSHPTPTVSSGNATCLDTQFREDVSGTYNMFTGVRETVNILRTRVYQGVSVPQPCPVCGGVCVGGTQDGEICEGTCSISADACRFDTDCPPSETCTTTSPDCPDASCELELVCIGGLRDGEVCRIGASTPFFGTVSADCPSVANISGDGLEIEFNPASTAFQQLDYTYPCTATGFELFDCPCPPFPADPTGTPCLMDAECSGSEICHLGFCIVEPANTPTKPNSCLAACDAGAELGTGCGTGNSTGVFTTCVGGANNNKACDEDTDCPGGACSGNPTHCVGTGNPALELNKCTTNGDCGLGTCQDACPSGRCVPLCEPDVSDPQDGICSAGPIEYKCNGAKDSFRTCTFVEFSGSCSATCSIAATACLGDADCPSGESCEGSCVKARLCEAGDDGILGTPDDNTGAGTCEIDKRRCFLNPIIAEGGDTIKGGGSPEHANSPTIYCTPPVNSLIINAATGLGGPGRLRSQGTVITNGVSSLP